MDSSGLKELMCFFPLEIVSHLYVGNPFSWVTSMLQDILKWIFIGSRDRETATESRGKWGEKTPLYSDESSDRPQGTQETWLRTS